MKQTTPVNHGKLRAKWIEYLFCVNQATREQGTHLSGANDVASSEHAQDCPATWTVRMAIMLVRRVRQQEQPTSFAQLATLHEKLCRMLAVLNCNTPPRQQT
jgi:hypothetical protein